MSCCAAEVRKLVRDATHEREFRPFISQTITDLVYPDDTVYGDLQVVTANGYVIEFVASCFWNRPCIERVEKRK